MDRLKPIIKNKTPKNKKKIFINIFLKIEHNKNVVLLNILRTM